MSTAAPATGHTESGSQIAPETIDSIAPLAQRLIVEVDAAEERVEKLQAEATRVFLGREKRTTRFVAVADRIDAILQQCLETFLQVSVFQDIKRTIRIERGPEGSGFHGRTATLTAPYSDKRPAPMEFSFRVGHDGTMENAVMDYRMEVLPVFVKFEGHDQLVIPIEKPNESAIAAWIDDKLVGFTRTYFEVYFHDEYQQKSLATDPVMNVRFPKAFAAAKKEYQKRTFYFYSKESYQLFENDPSDYIQSA